MFSTPTTMLLILSRPPTTRPVYDVPPVIVASPRWRILREFATRFIRTAPEMGETLSVDVGRGSQRSARAPRLVPEKGGKSRSTRRASRWAAHASLATQKAGRSSRTR
jgi:hypothetical protein